MRICGLINDARMCIRPVGILDVLPVPSVVHHLLQRGFEVLGDGGIGALVDRDAGRGMRDVDERGRCAVERAERILHLVGDVHELRAALGLEMDLSHCLRILRDDASRPSL